VLSLFCDRDINPMTLKFEGDLDILKMYLRTENEAASLRHAKVRALLKEIRKYVLGKNVISCITLSVIVTDIPIKPQQFPTSSF